MKKVGLVLILTGIAVIAAILVFSGKIKQYAFLPNDVTTPQAQTNQPSGDPEVVAENLTVPWSIAILPDGDMLVTERAGTLKRIGKTNASYPIAGAQQLGEGGLMGMALHPNFEKNKYLYLYFTTTNETNKLVRYKFTDRLTEEKVIIDGIPGAPNHDGGRIAFGPDNRIYITTGDAQSESSAQSTSNLAGKILRINDDGSIPADNPFGNAVYSYGHRNPQGLAWDAQGRLWASEHGPSGRGSGYDEINLIEKGKNYGWPIIKGTETRTGMETPKLQSGGSTTWAPAGLAVYNNSVYFAGLRGQSLYKATISGANLTGLESMFSTKFGRLRAVTIYKGYLYFSTSNQDGRGKPQTGDDKIYRIKL